jgi:hypothetical protein
MFHSSQTLRSYKSWEHTLSDYNSISAPSVKAWKMDEKYSSMLYFPGSNSQPVIFLNYTEPSKLFPKTKFR